MKLRFLFLFLFVFSGICLRAQNKVGISGTVLNSDKEPVEKATVQVLNLNDSANVAGVVTDSEGHFNLSVLAGNYLLKISFIGYADDIRLINASKQQNVVEPVILSESNIMLDSTVVIGYIAEMVIKGDTIEYNADSYKVLPSAVVEDLLKKLPGTEVDSDGKITVNGKEVKKILVDKKEFFSDDPKVASKNLPAAMVDKVQVWDKKSDMAEMTGFDDGNEETVINLTVKPGMKQGLFGNISGGIGNKERYDANAMANYMRNNNQFTLLGRANNTNNTGFSDFASAAFSGSGPSRGGMSFGGRNGILKSVNGGFNFASELSSKFKWGGNIQSGNTDNDVISSNYNQNYITGGDQYETRNSTGNNSSGNFNGNFRMEWSPSENTKLIFTPSIRHNKNANRQQSSYLTTLIDPNDSINWGRSMYSSDGSGLNLNGTIEMSHKFGKKGRTVSISLSGGLSEQTNEGSNNSITEYKNSRTQSVITDQIFNTENNSYNWRGFLSYVEPIGTNNFVQLTYSYRNSYSEQDRQTFKNNDMGVYNVVDTSSTKVLENDFENQELRINFRSVREKYDYTVGFAAQPSKSVSTTIAPDTAYSVTNNVINFAPIMQFVYRWDRQTNLRINYNGSVNQPSTTQLSNVRDESNPLNITYGNPDLNPSFRNGLRIQFRKSDQERTGTMTLSSNINLTTNDIVRYSEVDSVGKRISTYRNINGNWDADVRFMINKQLLNRKFSVNSTTRIRYTADNSFINNEQNTAKDVSLDESPGVSYRSDLFDFGLRGNIQYTETNNTLSSQANRKVYNYGGSANTTVYLPWNFSIESDLNYSANSGYSDGFQQNEWLWNASVTKQMFKQKNGILKFTMYDILKERSNITRTSSAQSLQYASNNTIGSYFMVQFIYRFMVFKKGTSQSDFRRERDFRRGERPDMEGGTNERLERPDREGRGER
jgi:hypothetical protein